MLPKPVVSAAPAGPDPGQSGRGQEGDPGGSCSPVLPGPRHQPLKAVSLSLAALAGKGQVTSARAGSREEPPAPPSSDPSSFVPSAQVSHEARAQPQTREEPAPRGANSIRQRNPSSEILVKSNFRVLIPWLSAPLGSSGLLKENKKHRSHLFQELQFLNNIR